MTNIEKELANAFVRISDLDGIVVIDDEIGIRAGHFNDYLLAGYLAQLIERDEIEIKIKPERIPYLRKLLHCEVEE